MSFSREALVFLLILTVQNASLNLTTSYSRNVLQEKYNAKTSVLLIELLKFSVCVFVIARETRDISRTVAKAKTLIQTSLPVAVPAACYFLQNWLAFVALQYLDAATYGVVNQLKVASAALFTVVLLGRSISWNKWRALIILVVGVALVQREPGDVGPPSATSWLEGGRPFGFLVALIVVALSGFAGVFTEKFLKSGTSAQPSDIFEKNLQLAAWGMASALFALFFDQDALAEKGFFYGYSRWSFLIIILNAAGGLLVAAVVMKTDTIIKGFATSAAIVLTTICSVWLFDVDLAFEFYLGATCVVVSIFNYSQPDLPTPVKAAEKPNLEMYKRDMETHETVPLCIDVRDRV